MTTDRARRYGASAFRLPQPQTRPFSAGPGSTAVQRQPQDMRAGAAQPRAGAAGSSTQAQAMQQFAAATAGAPAVILSARAAGPAKVNFTDEQQAIIECRAPVVVGNAKAGTGKTTTGVGFAHRRPDKRFLYMAFNKTVQMEAEHRFGKNSNTEARTTHSMAWQAIGRQFGSRVPDTWRALTVRNEMSLANTRMAAMVQLVLTKFFQSTDIEVRLEHAADAETKFHAVDRELSEAVANAKLLWRRMQDRGDSVAVPHDAYLKMWALTTPRLNYDYLICDEWQDANPVTAQIVQQQRHAKILILGDPHQSIYAFRGAVNAMDQFPGAAHLHLSKTWRFGPKVAEVANLVLSELKKETVLIKAMGADVPYQSGAPVTKLARTNAQLFKDATLVMGQGVHWVGGVEKYELHRILDAYHLFANQRDRIKDPFLRYFSSFQDMAVYAEESKDRDAKILAEVVDEFHHDTPHLVDQVIRNAVKDPDEAQLRLTTGHKAKGLDWDYVQLANDFEILAETEALLADDPCAKVDQQELNLLYVGLTRAKKALALNDETRQWLANLPQHRAARANAMNRVRQRMQTRPSAA